MTLRNILLSLRDQLPLARLYRNFVVTKNAWGLFSKFSHTTKQETPKVGYRTRASAVKAAEKMQAKHGGKFRAYKCVYCDGYHIGKNRVV